MWQLRPVELYWLSPLLPYSVMWAVFPPSPPTPSKQKTRYSTQARNVAFLLKLLTLWVDSLPQRPSYNNLVLSTFTSHHSTFTTSYHLCCSGDNSPLKARLGGWRKCTLVVMTPSNSVASSSLWQKQTKTERTYFQEPTSLQILPSGKRVLHALLVRWFSDGVSGNSKTFPTRNITLIFQMK